MTAPSTGCLPTVIIIPASPKTCTTIIAPAAPDE